MSHVLKHAVARFDHYKAAPLLASGPFARPAREAEAELRCVFEEDVPEALLGGKEFLAGRPTDEDPPTFGAP